jgi:uncharacterized membrane protein SirB2
METKLNRSPMVQIWKMCISEQLPAFKIRMMRKVAKKRARQRKDNFIMPLTQVVFVLIVVGVVLWLINQFIPMASSIKSILNAIVVIGVLWWLGNVFGFFHSMSHIRIG